ncbi:AprD4 family radical SAM diol-dehydratase [Actinosynnema sp. NPDC050436]|uniref:AprD4 family radical SAM diol-dehydratase n=1 Tax=Actinosynnema sp. NPDC050436 TaxID=3155659 RepID=UPI0033C4AE93
MRDRSGSISDVGSAGIRGRSVAGDRRVHLVSPRTSFGRNLQRTYAGGLGTVNPAERTFLPPLDLLRLAGVLRQAGHVPVVVDEEVTGPAQPEPGDVVIGQVALASLREDAERLAALGAAGATTYAYTSVRHLDQWAELLDRSGCAGLLLPEAVPAVTRVLAGESVPGLVSPGGPMSTAHAFGPVEDEPLPARDLVDHRDYTFPQLPGHLVTTMNSGFGCPYPCRFYCPYPLGEGTRVRMYPVARVVAEFEQCAALGITAVVFRDPVFTFDRRRTVELCAALERANTGIRWWCETRVDRLDPELVRAMVAAGCAGAEVGVESGDAGLQSSSVRKRLRLDTVRALHATAAESGLRLFFLLLFGLPGETRHSIAHTLELVVELGLPADRFHISVITPYPGTELHDLALDKGWISGDQSGFTSFDAVMRTDHLDERDLVEALELVAELRSIGGGQAPRDALAGYARRLRGWVDAPHAS